jgi:hypothetical protein
MTEGSGPALAIRPVETSVEDELADSEQTLKGDPTGVYVDLVNVSDKNGVFGRENGPGEKSRKTQPAHNGDPAGPWSQTHTVIQLGFTERSRNSVSPLDVD